MTRSAVSSHSRTYQYASQPVRYRRHPCRASMVRCWGCQRSPCTQLYKRQHAASSREQDWTSRLPQAACAACSPAAPPDYLPCSTTAHTVNLLSSYLRVSPEPRDHPIPNTVRVSPDLRIATYTHTSSLCPLALCPLKYMHAQSVYPLKKAF